MRGIIYKYTNKYNNKVYIGQTVNEEKRRERWNSIYPYAGKYINRARIKYGVNAFYYEVLAEVYNDNRKILREILNELEIKFIALYNSKNPNFGYNLTDGGKSGNGQVISNETRKKQSISQKGKKKKPMSLQGRSNISKAHIGIESCRKKKVCQLDPNTFEVIKIWNSITEAVHSFGDKRCGNLIYAIQGRNGRKFYRGFRWKYYETIS